MKQSTWKLIGLALVWLNQVTATAQESNQENAKMLSLKEATSYALQHHNNAKNARLDVLIQEAVNAEVTANALPRINGKSEFIKYFDAPKSFIPGEFFQKPGTFQAVQFTPNYTSNLGISGNQILFDGSVFVALQARKTILDLMTQKANLTEEEIRYNVQKAYHSLVIAQKQFQIVKGSLANLRKMAQEQLAIYDQGFIEKIDIDRSNITINNLAADSLSISNLLSVSEQLLKFNMGMEMKTPIILIDTALDQHLVEAMSLANQEQVNNRTEMSLMQTQLKLNEYNLRRYQLSRIPSLIAFGNMGYNYASNDFKAMFNSKYIWSSFAGLQLNIPIFNGLLVRNQIKEAQLNLMKSKNSIEGLQLAIDFETQAAKTALKNSLLQAESQKRNLALSNSVLDLAEKKYKEGVGSSLEVTQAQTEHLRTQSNYFNALLNVINAEADYIKAQGNFKN